ncbi:MAG TPA: urea ABC transporter permease subunit UrtB [Abditibacterium sp.]|jgi:urea transport system permease protein
MQIYLQQAFNALSVASILLLVGLGLAITFGLMRVINMAHGEFIMAGAYMTYLCGQIFKTNPNVAFLVAIPFAFLVTAALGYLLESTVISRLYGRPLDTLLATWGVSLILQQAARSIFGSQNVDVATPTFLSGQLSAGPLTMPYLRLFIIALSIACVLGTAYFLYRTPWGRRIQAVMQNRNMAACLGISTRRVDAIAFSLGSGLAGIAGCAVALLGSIGSTTGVNYIVDAFMTVVLGGVGSVMGTVAGAIGIGILGTGWETVTNASLGKVLAFVCVIAFLQWKPAGLIAVKSRALD